MTFGDFNELFDFLNQCHMTQEEIGLSLEQLESDMQMSVSLLPNCLDKDQVNFVPTYFIHLA